MNNEYIPKVAQDLLPEVPFTIARLKEDGSSEKKYLTVTEKSLDNRYGLLELYIMEEKCYVSYYPADYLVVKGMFPN